MELLPRRDGSGGEPRSAAGWGSARPGPLAARSMSSSGPQTSGNSGSADVHRRPPCPCGNHLQCEKRARSDSEQLQPANVGRRRLCRGAPPAALSLQEGRHANEQSSNGKPLAGMSAQLTCRRSGSLFCHTFMDNASSCLAEQPRHLITLLCDAPPLGRLPRGSESAGAACRERCSVMRGASGRKLRGTSFLRRLSLSRASRSSRLA